MRARLRVVAESVLAAAWLSTVATAQSAVQERASVTAIEIPVNVLGKDGRFVAGLEAKDFELYDDGRKQPLNAVEVVDLGAVSAAGSAKARDVPITDPATQTTGRAASAFSVP